MSSGTFPLQVKLSLIDSASKELAEFNGILKVMAAPAKAAADKLAALGRELGVNKLGKALKDVNANASRTWKSLKGLAKDAAWVAASVGAASYSLYALTKKSADNAGALESQAKQAGIAVKSWERLSGAANLTGASTDTLHSGLVTLNKNVAATANGNRISSVHPKTKDWCFHQAKDILERYKLNRIMDIPKLGPA